MNYFRLEEQHSKIVYSLQVDLTYQIMKVEFKTTRKLS